MISAGAKRQICLRLGPFVNYTASWGFFWNKKTNKFELSTSYSFITWRASYYSGHAIQITILTSLLYMLFWAPTDIPDDVPKPRNQKHSKTLLVCMGFILWFLHTTVQSIGSLGVQYREEMAESINQAFKLDSQLTKQFGNQNSVDRAKTLEKLVTFANMMSLLGPLALVCSFFQPADPFRNFMENLLEADFTNSSPMTWILICNEAYAVLCCSTNVISWLLTILAVIYTSEEWLDCATPIPNLNGIWNCKQKLETNKLGTLSEQEVISIYRQLQLLTNLLNCCVAKVRVAYHHVSVLLLAVIATYALVNCNGAMADDGSVSSFVMFVVLVSVVVLVFFLVYCECLFFDRLEGCWQTFQGNLLVCCRRKSFCYKTAISFRPVTLRTAYPYFNVNISTFSDWCDSYINKVVDFLLTF